jgi:hypothetical protein
MLIKLSKGRLKKLEKEYVINNSQDIYPINESYNMVNTALHIMDKEPLKGFSKFFSEFTAMSPNDKYQLIKDWEKLASELNKEYAEKMRKIAQATVTGEIQSATPSRIYLNINGHVILAINAEMLGEKPKEIQEKYFGKRIKITGFISGIEHCEYIQNMIVAESVEEVA